MTDLSAGAWAGFPWPKKDEDGRTHQPVRRRSRATLGAEEPVSRMSERQREAWLRAFDREARNVRPQKVRRGHRGTYSWYAHQVLDYLMGWAVTTGRIYPSIRQIGETLGLGVKEVVRGLHQLKAGRWVSWERRIRPTHRAPGDPGPQIEQDTNFYRVHLPIAAAELLEGWRQARGRKSGLSRDERQRRARAAHVARERRDAERKVAALKGFLERARPADRRRIASQIADQEGAVLAALRREAAILDPADSGNLALPEPSHRLRRDSPKGRE